MTCLALLFTRDDIETGVWSDACRFIQDLAIVEPSWRIRCLVAGDAALPADAPFPVTFLPGEAGSGWLGAWRLSRQLEGAYRSASFDLLFVFSAAAQRGAGLWAQRIRRPAFVIRLWLTATPVADTRLDHLSHNRGTAVNILPSADDATRMRGQRPEHCLWLDNPFVLHDGLPLSEADRTRLTEGLAGMTTPTRTRTGLAAAQSSSHIRLTYVTHFYLNQNRTETISALLRQYAGYSPELLDRIHFVIVDDGSPLEVAPPDVDLNLTWLRINEDVRWNQGGARNLGAIYAKSDNILMTDLDLAFPESTLQALVDHGPLGKTLYKFHEANPDGSRPRKGHPNNFFLSRGRFLRYYGYDEELAGNYGAEDFRFVKFQKAQGTRQRYFDRRHTYYRRREIDRRDSYHSLVRDLSANTPVDYRKRLEMELYGHENGHSRMFLNFTWTMLLDRYRSHAPAPTPDPAWKRRWILRSLLPW
jgi:hypothetical protein